ncbi:MAG: amidohydrolase family protein [Flavobacteriaceae bacterium]
MKKGILIMMAMLGILACKQKAENTTGDAAKAAAMDEQAIKKIDVHAHYKYDRDYLPEEFKKWNMQGVLVDVFHEDSVGVTRSWDNYLAVAKARPELFYLCSGYIGIGIDAPDYADKIIAQLDKEIGEGARMVKVWKNFGMVTKDASGKYIQIDDPRLQPIWDFLKSKDIPVMAHIGEPEQAWRELDPTSPHYGYYENNPQYHAYNFPEIPSYETIIAARDHWIEKNPDLKILCAHLGSMSHNVDMVAERLDKYPNMYVETAARFGDLARQDSEKVNRFFEQYQDRIMFGSDFGNNVPQDELTPTQLDQERAELDADYALLWKYLSTADSVEIRGQKNRGIALSREVLEKVYYNNVANFLKLK